MCHLCRKIKALGSIDSEVTKPIFTILSKLHKSAEPRMGDMWLWRLEQTKKLYVLLGRLYRFIPISALKAILDDVDKDISHIKKSMVDHPPLRRTRKCDSLKSIIGPSESTSVRFHKENELQAEEVGKSKHSSNQLVGNSAKRSSTEGVVLDRSPPAELEGSDIDPPSPRIRQSICIVDEWFDRCESSVRPSTQTNSDNESVVSDAIGEVRGRPQVDGSEIWKNLTTQSSDNLDKAVQSMVDEKRRNDEKRSMSGDKSLGPSVKASLECAVSTRNAKSRNESSAWDSGCLLRNDIRDDLVLSVHKETLTMSSLPSVLNAGSMIRRPQLSICEHSPKQGNTDGVSLERRSDRFSSSSVSSPKMPVAIGRGPSPLRAPRAESEELTMLQTETQEKLRKVRTRSKLSYSNGHEKWYNHTLCKPTQQEQKRSSKGSGKADENRSKDLGMSYAIRSSRRRRAERGATTVPFNNRYRHDERQKHWQTQKP